MEPGKRKPPARFNDSHGSEVNSGNNKCQIYYEALDSTITTTSAQFDQDGTTWLGTYVTFSSHVPVRQIFTISAVLIVYPQGL